MSYELGKTLEENIKSNPILNETHLDVDEQASVLAKDLKAAVSTEQKISALANFFKISEDAAKLASAKDMTTLNKELQKAIATDIKGGFKGGLGQATKEVSKQQAIKEILSSNKKLTEGEIVSIIERIKNTNKQKAMAAETKSATKAVTPKKKKVNQENQAVELEPKTNGEGITSTPEGGAKVVEPTPVGEPTKPPVELKPNKIKELIDGIKNKKWNWKQTVKWVSALGISAWALWWIISEFSDTVPTDMPKDEPEKDNQWAPCLYELLKNKEGVIAKSEKLGLSVLVKTKEYPSGIMFYSNGRVMNVETKKMGRWKCKEGKAKLQEQVQFDENLSSDVEEMIDLLDFPVTQQNLYDANILLQKYVKNGKGKEFLSLYQQSGFGGGDLKKSLDNIVVTNTKSVQYKTNLYKLINQISSGTSSTGGAQTSDKIGLKNIDIVWDAESTSTGTGKSKTFVDCNSKELPHQYGCISEKIRDVQKCLSLTPDSKFGPKTFAAIKEKYPNQDIKTNGLTQAIYDDIMKNCNGEMPDDMKRRMEPLPQSITNPNKIKLSDLVPINLSSKLQDIKLPDVSSVDLYKTFVQAGYIKGEDDNRRIKYKGPDLDELSLKKLDNTLYGMGYQRIKQKEKEYGVKYVWEKI
jgi:hypothetical protein